MASLLRDADEIRQIQATVSGLAVDNLEQLVDLVGGLPPETARNLLIDTVPSVAQTYGDLNAVAAGEWFEDMRSREVGASRPAVLADSVPTVQVEQSIRFSAQHLFRGDLAGLFAYLQGAMIKWVNQPARMTIIDSVDADPIGYGWQRVVRPGGCDFCEMLADRGGVYTRKSVWFASHANCNCGVVPSWDSSLPEVDVMAYVASKRMDSVRRRAEGNASDKEIARSRARSGGSLHGSITRQNRLTDQERAQSILDDHRERIREWVNRSK